MQYFAASGAPQKQSHGALIVGVYAKNQLSDAAQALDKASGGAVAKLAKAGDVASRVGATSIARNVKSVSAERIVFVGLGAKSALDLVAWRKAVAAASRAVTSTGAASALSYLAQEYPEARQSDKAIRLAVIELESSLYRFDELKTKGKPPASKLRRFGFGVATRGAANKAKLAAAEGAAMAAGASLAKDLGNRPANVCTPTHLAKQAQDMAKKYKSVTAQILNEPQLRKLKMGSFLSSPTAVTNRPK